MQDLFKIDSIHETEENTVKIKLVAACSQEDRAGESMDYPSSKPNFEAWSKEQFEASNGKNYGNLRVMHNQYIAAGIIIAPLEYDDVNEVIRAEVEVVDPAEVFKCRKGVYTGASIGGKCHRFMNAKGQKKYTAYPNELSLADRSCQPDAKIELMKNDGTTEILDAKLAKSVEKNNLTMELKVMDLNAESMTSDQLFDKLIKSGSQTAKKLKAKLDKEKDKQMSDEKILQAQQETNAKLDALLVALTKQAEQNLAKTDAAPPAVETPAVDDNVAKFAALEAKLAESEAKIAALEAQPSPSIAHTGVVATSKVGVTAVSPYEKLKAEYEAAKESSNPIIKQKANQLGMKLAAMEATAQFKNPNYKPAR